MSGVAIKVLAGDALARLQGMEERGNNLTGVFRSFGNYMKGSIQKNFDAEGRPTRWQPLAPGTLGGWLGSRSSYWNKPKKDGSRTLNPKGREAKGGRKVLTASARLRNSISPVAITPRGLTIGTNVKYAAIHQFGGKIPPITPKSKKALYWPGAAHPVKSTKGATIPARPYLLFQDEDVEYFNRMLLEYILTRRI